jgi:hypothetical protein
LFGWSLRTSRMLRLPDGLLRNEEGWVGARVGGRGDVMKWVNGEYGGSWEAGTLVERRKMSRRIFILNVSFLSLGVRRLRAVAVCSFYILSPCTSQSAVCDVRSSAWSWTSWSVMLYVRRIMRGLSRGSSESKPRMRNRNAYLSDSPIYTEKEFAIVRSSLTVSTNNPISTNPTSDNPSSNVEFPRNNVELDARRAT